MAEIHPEIANLHKRFLIILVIIIVFILVGSALLLHFYWPDIKTAVVQ